MTFYPSADWVEIEPIKKKKLLEEDKILGMGRVIKLPQHTNWFWGFQVGDIIYFQAYGEYKTEGDVEHYLVKLDDDIIVGYERETEQMQSGVATQLPDSESLPNGGFRKVQPLQEDNIFQSLNPKLQISRVPHATNTTTLDDKIH